MIICGELTKMNNNKNKNQKNTPAGGLTRNKRRSRRQRAMRSVTTQVGVQRGLSQYPAVPGDSMKISVNGTRAIFNRAAGLANYAFVLKTSQVTTPGYFTLGNLFPIVDSLGGVYSRWMIERITFSLRMITPSTAGGFAAANYEPDNSAISGPPTNLTDVSQAQHLVLVNPTQEDSFSVAVSKYFGDWRTTRVTGSNEADTECGVCQIFSGNASLVDLDVALLTVKADLVFCGYRAT